MKEASLLRKITAVKCSEGKLTCVLIESMSVADYNAYVDRWREENQLPTPYVEWRAVDGALDTGRLVAV